MESELQLAEPFYTAEAIERFLRPFLGDAAISFPVSALRDARFCETLNAALRQSVETHDCGA